MATYIESLEALAVKLGCSKQKLSQLRRINGCPEKTMRGWNLDKWQRFLAAYNANRTQGRLRKSERNDAPVIAEPPKRGRGRPRKNRDEDEYEELTAVNWNEEARKEQALERRYKRELLQGKLCNKADVIRAYSKHVRDAANRLRTVPKLVSQLVTQEGLEAILSGDRDSKDIVGIVEKAIKEQIDDVCRTLQRGARVATGDDSKLTVLEVE